MFYGNGQRSKHRAYAVLHLAATGSKVRRPGRQTFNVLHTFRQVTRYAKNLPYNDPPFHPAALAFTRWYVSLYFSITHYTVQYYIISYLVVVFFASFSYTHAESHSHLYPSLATAPFPPFLRRCTLLAPTGAFSSFRAGPHHGLRRNAARTALELFPGITTYCGAHA